MRIFDMLFCKIMNWYFKCTYKKIEIHIPYHSYHWKTGYAIFNDISSYYEYENIVIYFDFPLSPMQISQLAECMVINQSTSSDDSAYPMLNNVKFYFHTNTEYDVYNEKYNKFIMEDLSCSRL